MKRFQLWIKRPSLALPVCSSESARIRPSAEASGIVRNARRKLLALTRRGSRVRSGEATRTDRSFYYLTRIPSRQIQHVEEKSKFTGQTELLLTQMILHQTPDWLQEIQNLTNDSINPLFLKLKLYKLYVSYLDHAVTIGIGDVRLQASKQGSVVMLEIKVLQSKFGVFNCDLIAHKDPKSCYFHFYGSQNQKLNSNLSVFFGNHVEVRLFFAPNW